MEQFKFNQIDNEDFSCLITVLDYEMVVVNELEKLRFPISRIAHKRILVDLALKVGMIKWRFLSIEVNSEGKIIPTSAKYEPKIDEQLIVQANKILSLNKEILKNSILTESQKEELLNMSYD